MGAASGCGEPIGQGAAELFQGPVLDLADPLLRDAEALPKGLERRLILGEPALTQDAQLALGEHGQRLLKPAEAPLAVDRGAHRLVRQIRPIHEEIHPL